MKDKRLIYVLLPAVLVIWIIIGQRFYAAVKGDDPAPYVPTTGGAVTSEATPDVYELRLDYADPFLKEEPTQVTLPPLPVHDPISALSVAAGSTSPTATVDWSGLTYSGMISNNQTDHRVGMLTLKGTRKLVRENDRVATFTIEKIYQDSVRVRFGEEVKHIVRAGRIRWLSRRP